MTGFANEIPCGALLLVSDQPMVSEGVKTEKSDQRISGNYVRKHVEIGMDALNELINKGHSVKHLRFE